MTRAINVAAAILERTGPMTTMKLQKLLYYCQGWHMAWDGEPLFNDKIEAWANGPVVRNVYNAHRGKFRLDADGLNGGDASLLSESERESVDAVLESYGEWTARQLVLKTHSERPWIEARGGLPLGSRSDRTISKETMADYFAGLLADGD